MKKTSETPVQEYATFQQLFKRQRQRLRKKQMGVKPGSGYEIRGGVKRRMSAQRVQNLKRRGRRMARSARQQRSMWVGRQRAKSLTGMQPKFAGGKRIKSDIDFGNAPAIVENERRFSCEHILQAIEQWKDGNTTEALRRLTIDPKFQLSPIALMADAVVKKIKEEEIPHFVDVEIVEGTALAVYFEKGDADLSNASDALDEFGDVGKIAVPDKALSDTQKSDYYVFLIKPTEKSMKAYDTKSKSYAEDVTEDDEPTKLDTPQSVLDNPGHVGVNRPPMNSVGGTGTDHDINPSKDDVAHLRPDYDDDPVFKRLSAKRDAKVKKKADLPLGVDPSLGQPR